VALGGLRGTLAGQARGWDELWLDLLAAAGAGLVVATAAAASRCPSCQRGLISGRSGHCGHCGALVK